MARAFGGTRRCSFRSPRQSIVFARLAALGLRSFGAAIGVVLGADARVIIMALLAGLILRSFSARFGVWVGDGARVFVVALREMARGRCGPQCRVRCCEWLARFASPVG